MTDFFKAILQVTSAMASLLTLVCATLSVAEQADAGFQPNATPGQRAEVLNLKRAAEQGSAKAQCELSKAYMQGTIFRQDITEAVKWVRASADQGYAEAEVDLAVLYLEGPGVKRDNALAFQWMSKAADQGDAKSEYNIGMMYGIGQGVAKNIPEGVRWYMKSAEHGYPLAAYNVGFAYLQGIGVARDDVEGYMWHYLAASRFGYAPSRKVLESLNPRLGPVRVAAARKKANDWIKAHPNVKGVPL